MIFNPLLKTESKLEIIITIICIFAFPVIVGSVYFEDLFKFLMSSYS